MLEQTLKRLADTQQSLSHRLLRSLSGLTPPDLTVVQQAWPSMPTSRRRQIVHALVEMAEDDVEMDFVDLFQALLADSDSEVRATAVSGLWETSDERHVDPLITLLRKDPSAEVRAAAADILGHFGMLAADERLHGGRAKRLLAALLDTFHSTDDPLNTDEVRRNALESLAFFGDDPRIDAAIREAYQDENIALRAGSLSAMGCTFNQEWEPIVLRELDNPEPEMRYEATRAAGDLWLEAAVPQLIAMVKDLDREVCLMAVWSLGEIGGLQAKATLTQLLESHDEGMRDAAEDALEELRFNENPLGFDDLLKRPKGGKGKKAE